MDIIRHIPGRGYNVSGVAFRDGDGLTMYATKKMAAAFAKRFNWPARYITVVYTPLFGGYAVAQPLAFGDHSTLVFLADDGTTREYPV